MTEKNKKTKKEKVAVEQDEFVGGWKCSRSIDEKTGKEKA